MGKNSNHINMKTKGGVEIIDFIGAYCGMDHYDEAFAHLLNDNGYEVRVLSDFESIYGKRYFPEIFGRAKWQSLLFLIYTIIRLWLRMAINRKIHYIYLSYGEYYDMLFMLGSLFNRKMIVDVHEVHALKYDDFSVYSKIFESLYRKGINSVIYHSDRTKTILDRLNFKGNLLYVPHFKYEFDTSYNINNVAHDIRKAFCSDKKKFLFFGNIRRVKGIDIIETAFANLVREGKNFELVIAGMNADNYPLDKLREIASVFDRHINDDEMKYLYSNCDYVLLPYRKSSQSGIFEMASYFRKPMLLSDIEYFKKQLEIHSDWGKITCIDRFEDLVRKNLLETNEYYKVEYDNLSEDYTRFIKHLEQTLT